jgi:diacylglycerol kinase family enzyme
VDSNSIVVVLNPAAGGGKTLTALPKVQSAIEALGRPYHIHLTKSVGDGRDAACKLAREGAAVVIAVGGDGTIHEVVNGLCDSGTRVPLGVVPAGNGSDFARTTGASKRIEEAIAAARPSPMPARRHSSMSLDSGTTLS